MQITRTTDYAVRAMTYLTDCEAGTRATVGAVSAAAGITPTLMSKVLQRLVTARLVMSHRGKAGGFHLARPAVEISLLDVLVAMEGPLGMNLCLVSRDACSRQPWCAAHLVWAEVQRKVAAILGAASIAQLAAVSPNRRSEGGLTVALDRDDRR